MNATRTITRRSRNLGFGFSNQPVQVWNHDIMESRLHIAPPAGPSVTGSWRDIVDAYERTRRNHEGAAISTRLYVDGAEVLDLTVSEFVGLIQTPGQELTVTVAEAHDARR